MVGTGRGISSWCIDELGILGWHTGLSAEVNETQTWFTVRTRVTCSFRVRVSLALPNFILGLQRRSLVECCHVAVVVSNACF